MTVVPGRHRLLTVLLTATIGLAASSCGGQTFEHQSFDIGTCRGVCAVDDGTVVVPPVILALTAESAMPNSIVWSWDPAALQGEVVAYSLWYATSAGDLDNHGGSARLWGASDDANLAWAESPYGPGEVHFTTVSELAPETEYYAELWTSRLGSDSQRAAVGRATTTAVLPSAAVIFSETEHLLREATLLTFQPPFGTGEGYGGVSALWLDGTGSTESAEVNRTDLMLPALSAAELASGYLEYFIRVDEAAGTPASLPWVTTAIATGTGSVAEPVTFYNAERYSTVPASAVWHRIHVPLASFLDDTGNALPAGAPIYLRSMRLQAAWPAGHRVWVDEIIVHF
ncbi:MAG: hypothetical protein AAB426_15035 [Myxococcota bacterium]